MLYIVVLEPTAALAMPRPLVIKLLFCGIAGLDHEEEERRRRREEGEGGKLGQ